MQNETHIAFDKPIYNHFTHLHGLSEGSIQLPGDQSDHIFRAPILEFGGYIPVVHEPTYIDMGSYIHFNPSPIFVPAPSGVALLAVAGLILARRKRR